jgi:hypothetical protein
MRGEVQKRDEEVKDNNPRNMMILDSAALHSIAEYRCLPVLITVDADFTV